MPLDLPGDGKPYGPGTDCCDPATTVELETGIGHQLAVRGFVALWHGEHPEPGDLGADPSTIEALERRGLIVVDPDGHIAGIHGLASTPTVHRIAHGGRLNYTWCAFDAIGIPAALELDAEAHTICPTCGQPLEVSFTGGQPTAPADLRLWLPTTQCDHVLNDLCAHANLYCNEQHLATNPTRPANGTVLTVASAADLGRATWNDAAAAVQMT